MRDENTPLAPFEFSTNMSLSPYTSGGPFSIFSYPQSLARDLLRSGFDTLSAASAHTNDRGEEGVYQTLDTLTDAGAHVLGVRHASYAPCSRSEV